MTHCHKSRDPPIVRHTSRNPPIFCSTCIHTYVFIGRFVLVRGGSCLGVLSGVFCLEGFVRGCFCPSPFCQNTSVTTESHTSLSILGFVCMKKFERCDVTCSWTLPLSQTVTPSRTPSPLERGDALYGRPNAEIC